MQRRCASYGRARLSQACEDCVNLIGYCSLLCLSADDFRSFLATYPGLHKQIKSVAGSRLRENEAAILESHQL
jgi:hypothetical protein